jgi:hypothetical protein
MFLQIDVFPDNGKDASTTLFLSPANIVNQDDPPSGDEAGRLLTIGRKDCDVLLDKDKTISRRHALLRLVSNDPKYNCGIAARNEEEIQACQDSPLGMCIVLENFSKGGSYLVKPDNSDPSQQEPKAKERGGDETDDETDDEGVVSQHQMVSQQNSTMSSANGAISNAAKIFYGTTSVCYDTVGLGNTKVLSFQEGKDDTMFVQFGQSLVTRPTIRITWIPLRMVFSSSISSTVKKSLYLAGALAMDGVPDETTTHYVTKDVSPSAKVLIAWCRGIPIVSPDYCKALIDRNDMTTPLPKPDLEFSTDKANRNALSKITFLSILPKSEDTEQLAEAAGGTVIRLHERFPKDADILHHIESLVKEQEEKGKRSNVLVVLEVPNKTKGVPRGKVALFNKIRKLGIPATNAKGIAKAISNQAPLQDTDHNVIVAGDEVQHYDDNDMEVDAEKEPEKETPEEAPTPPEPNQPAQEATQETHKRKEDEPQREKATSPKKRRTDSDAKGSNEAVQEKDTSMVDPKPVAESRPKPMEKGPVRKENSSKTKQLEKADKNGWFTTAPKDDSLRKEFRKKASKTILEETGLQLEQAATSRGIFVVVDPEDGTEQYDSQANRTRVDQGLRFGRRPRSNSGAPNFKKFRKNYVAPVDMDNYILLVEHVSEKTQKQREMNEHARKLEEDQREADALFRGFGMENAPKKRRRKD